MLSIFQTTFYNFLSIFLIFGFSFGVEARIYSDLLRTVIVLLIAIILQIKYFKLSFSMKSLKWSINFSYPRLPSLMIGLFHQSFDKSMITNFKGLAETGIYDLSQKMSHINRMFIGSISRAWAPFFMKKAEEKDEGSKKIIIKKYKEIVMLFNISSFFMCLFCEEVIKIFTDKDFHHSMFLVPIFISTLLFVHSITAIAKPQIAFSEKLHLLLPSSILSLFVNISMNIVLIPFYGAIGAVFATFASSIVSNVLLFYLAQKAYPLPINYPFLIGQYTLFLLFLIPIYFFMMVDHNLLISIPLKLTLLLVYIFISLRLSFISYNNIIAVFRTLKINI